jgi:hypothetical protein
MLMCIRCINSLPKSHRQQVGEYVSRSSDFSYQSTAAFLTKFYSNLAMYEPVAAALAAAQSTLEESLVSSALGHQSLPMQPSLSSMPMAHLMQ